MTPIRFSCGVLRGFVCTAVSLGFALGSGWGAFARGLADAAPLPGRHGATLYVSKQGDNYYVIYLHAAVPGHNGWISFLARSVDLETWELSPFNPILEAGPGEGINNSDVDLFEYRGPDLPVLRQRQPGGLELDPRGPICRADEGLLCRPFPRGRSGHQDQRGAQVALRYQYPPNIGQVAVYCPEDVGTEPRAWSHATSTLLGEEMFSVSCAVPMGKLVRPSRHLWISEWPSAKPMPPAPLW